MKSQLFSEDQRAALQEATAALSESVSALCRAFGLTSVAVAKWFDAFSKCIPAIASLCKKYGIYSEVKEGRVRHLSLYSKKKRVRKKNFHRLEKMMKGGKKI